MDCKKTYDFYFNINGEQKGPFYSCPCVQKSLSIEYNYSKYFKQMLEGNDDISSNFVKRRKLHERIIKKIMQGKIASESPTCKFIITPEENYDSYKFLDTKSSIILNFEIIDKLLPEKEENAETLKLARKDSKNYNEIMKFNSLCSEEKAYLFLLIFYHASQLKLDIILAGMYYMGAFELALNLLELCDYKHFEIYLLETDANTINKKLDVIPEYKYQDFIYKTYRNLYETIVYDRNLLITKKADIYKANLNDYLKSHKAEKLSLEIIENERKKYGGGYRKYKTKSLKVKLY
jgi:hypothetical protein